jgi:isopentenyldiphosphate isomerase
MEEIVDIVDENDKVIRQEKKSVCHKNKILHRGVNIFVFKDKSYKEILLQKRSQTKKSNPSKICTPGGHLISGETYLQGAKREFFEEQFNSKINKNYTFEELFKIKKSTHNDYEYMTIFRIICEGPFSPDPKEVEISYFKDIKIVLKEIDENAEKYTPTTIILLKEYQKNYL